MRILLIIVVILVTLNSHAQYKYDNSKFQAVYLEDLCNTLKNNPDYILLDVRSKGEHYDTSAFTNLNIGHLKNAINIDIRELPLRWNELNKYKDKPVFVYCSHSQRSRRVSKSLADSGFAKVFNINGGLTSLQALKSDLSLCPGITLETNLPYSLVSARQVNQNVLAGKGYFIIDIRNDSVFNGTTTDERRRAIGIFPEAANIPMAKLADQVAAMRISKPILVVDDYGNDSPKAVQILNNAGFKDVSVLFGGMEGWVQFLAEEKGKTGLKYSTPAKYHILVAEGFDQLMKKDPKTVVIDIRTADEFNNKAKEIFHNVGHIKNARNIPYSEIQQGIAALDVPKSTPIVVHTFSGGNDVFNTAKMLTDAGFTNVNVLWGGYFNLRWRAANYKGKAYLKDWAVNVPEENL